LAGKVRAFLGSTMPLRQLIALTACGMHRRDPGGAIDAALESPSAALVIRALRVIGQVGRLDLKSVVESLVTSENTGISLWAAWTSVLLGDRGGSLARLAALGLSEHPSWERALRLAAKALPLGEVQRYIEPLWQTPNRLRRALRCAGLSGDLRYVDPIIESMSRPDLARVAFEAFMMITGADPVTGELESLPPDGWDEPPTMFPEDEIVELPEDLPLIWPNTSAVVAWWQTHRKSFDPGMRYFLGQLPTPESCVVALSNGRQTQRVAAAEWLCVLEPGTVLFNTSAPSRRQKRLLSAIES
jgi:uncharacterized protein (TIGR02270 family)